VKTYLLVLGFFCLLTVGLVTVWHQVDTLRVGYDVSRLRRRVEDLQRDCNRLTVSITGLKSPPVIEGLARLHGLELVRPHHGAPWTEAPPEAAWEDAEAFEAPSRIDRDLVASSGCDPLQERGRTHGRVNGRGVPERP
jgi:hypothetical protein